MWSKLHHKAAFLRLQIENTGLSSIKGCAGYITSITKHITGETIRNEREVLELKWSHRGATPRDIPRHAFFYIDIAALHRIGSTNNVLLLGADLPSSLDELLDGKSASFELKILIAADNAAPVEGSVKFKYDPNSQDLIFLYDQLFEPIREKREKRRFKKTR